MHFAMITAFEPAEDARAHVADAGLTLPFYRTDATGAQTLGVRAAPAQLIVDPAGRVVWTSDLWTFVRGAGPLLSALDELLAGQQDW